ncbi:conserved hypothetical protein [Planktothrix serta PCC 8927]|uniref:Uncharacterized protein n=1 Tax=Planktothrix serta PCC 8927 TaxID=671068 RepID=A0A7Z9BR61_9CYAN|nr:hypothetical protein [Planktothrix serta]VXD19003.1 conserved hypothetical protein [Planktothrix serta PCC 8927]
MKNMIPPQSCPHCEGKGYIEIRDCSGEIQREETCLFCEGTGELIDENDITWNREQGRKEFTV